MPSDSRDGDYVVFSERALKRVMWVDNEDPNNKLTSLFNPAELPLSVAVSVGELNPIGWSQPVQQYAHTGALQYNVSLPFSIRGYHDRTIPFTDMHAAHSFFRSFCYGETPGEAPHFLIMVWPLTAYLVNTVRSVAVNIEAWDEGLNPTRYTVDLQLVEVRRSFLSSKHVLNGGLGPDGAVRGADSFAKVQEKTGRPVRVKGSLSQSGKTKG